MSPISEMTRPAPYSSSISFTSPTSVDRTGTPMQSASRITIGIPSNSEVRIKPEAIKNTSAMFSTKGMRRRFFTSRSRINSSTTGARSPSPTITNNASSPACCLFKASCKKSIGRFWPVSRPANTKFLRSSSRSNFLKYSRRSVSE